MANFVSRNVLICVVPAVVLLLSVYWFRKKKKIKPEITPPINKNSLPVEKGSYAYNSSANIYSPSPVESTSDFSNTYSDASSISSPENSLRTPSLSGEASTDVVDDDSIASLGLSNHLGQLNYNISISKDEEIVQNNSNSQNLSNEKSDSSNISFSNVSFDCKEKTLNDSYIESKENAINLFCNALDKSVENSSADMNDQVNQSSFNGSLHKNDADNLQVNESEDISTFVDPAVNEVIDGPAVAIKQNTSVSEFFEQTKVNHFQNCDRTVESDCHDSHSSVLDENSLSSVSDESEKQNSCKYKDSPSSAFDGNSLSDESEKTDISNEHHNTMNLKSDENCKDSVGNDIESADSNKRGEQYSIKLSKNSYLVKTILSTDTSSEVSSSKFSGDNVSSAPSSHHNYSVLSDSFQSLSSENYFISVSKEDLGYIDKQNQPLQLGKEVDSCEDNCNSSVATSVTSEAVSLDSENVISSTSSFKNLSQSEEQTNVIVDSINSDIISSTTEIVSEESIKVNGSSQIDSLPYTSTDTSSEAVKSPDPQLEPSPDKVADLDLGDVKGSATIPGLFVYEFELPQELCGRLIGRQGKHVKSIKERTNANVFIKRHPFDVNLKTVVVEGSRSSVHEALDIIRRKFPPSQFPTVTLIQTNMISSHGVPLPESLQLHLPEGASCDVILSSLVSAGHFFLQQPTHPTYPSLSTLDQCMITCYTQMDTPLLPQPVEGRLPPKDIQFQFIGDGYHRTSSSKRHPISIHWRWVSQDVFLQKTSNFNSLAMGITAGVICAAPVMNGWFRAQIIYVYENRTECEIKFVDYGGFSQVPISSLRQIRSDFMTLPFQASECYLANVRPVDRNAGWSSEATAVFEELAQGQILQALLIEYAEDGIPCVHLYRVQGVSSMFINRELVERGLAVWVDNGHWDPH